MARNGRRVNLTATIPVETKARVQAFARNQNNTTSRIVESAILAFLGDWGTEEDASIDAAQNQAAVKRHLASEQR